MDGADPHGPQLLTPHWPVDVRTEGSGPGQPRLGSPWRTLPTTQVPERSGTRGGEQAGPVSPSSPPGPGLTKHSPRGSARRAWEQAGGQPSFQSSRPGTIGGAAGWAHSVPVQRAGRRAPPCPDLARLHRTRGTPQERTSSPQGQRWDRRLRSGPTCSSWPRGGRRGPGGACSPAWARRRPWGSRPGWGASLPLRAPA